MTWVLTIGGICALIILHEFGHFAVAKAVGMRVERFSLFFPPKIIGIKRGETEYSIGALPLGGYVKITGMNPEEITPSLRELARQLGADKARVEDGLRVLMRVGDQWRDVTDALSPEAIAAAVEDQRRGYFNQPPWKRVAVIMAGPGVNLLIAFVTFWLILWIGSPGGALRVENLAPAVQTIVPTSTVLGVQAHEPATGVLRPGDRIVAIDGRRATVGTIEGEVSRHRCAGTPTANCRAATPVTLTVRRDGQTLRLSLYPQYDASMKRMRLGFGFAEVPKHFGPLAAAGTAVHAMWDVTAQTITGLGHALTNAKARHQVTSIVGIAQATNANVGFGPGYALVLLGFISLVLAVVNLFPFLPLDGGHVLWAVAEKVGRRRISMATMWRFSSVGILLLAFLVINGFSNDINRLTGS
jgi:regulator of sigma E protease